MGGGGDGLRGMGEWVGLGELRRREKDGWWKIKQKRVLRRKVRGLCAGVSNAIIYHLSLEK